MNAENRRHLFSFLWKLATALIAAIGTALGVSCASQAGML